MEIEVNFPEERIACPPNHGLSYHRLYPRWSAMMNRCYSPNNRFYHRYGGRGIRVIEEWHDVRNFLAWVEEIEFPVELQLDRVKNNEHYSPDNCVPRTSKKNTQNTVRSKYWIVDGFVFNSSSDAAFWFKKDKATIQNWCKGVTQNGVFYPPKPNCYSERKFA